MGSWSYLWLIDAAEVEEFGDLLADGEKGGGVEGGDVGGEAVGVDGAEGANLGDTWFGEAGFFFGESDVVGERCGLFVAGEWDYDDGGMFDLRVALSWMMMAGRRNAGSPAALSSPNSSQ